MKRLASRFDVVDCPRQNSSRGGVPLDVENAEAHAAGSWTGVRVAWRAERSHTPVSGDTQIWVASSNAILEPLRPSASRRLGGIVTRPAASAGG